MDHTVILCTIKKPIAPKQRTSRSRLNRQMIAIALDKVADSPIQTFAVYVQVREIGSAILTVSLQDAKDGRHSEGGSCLVDGLLGTAVVVFLVKLAGLVDRGLHVDLVESQMSLDLRCSLCNAPYYAVVLVVDGRLTGTSGRQNVASFLVVVHFRRIEIRLPAGSSVDDP